MNDALLKFIITSGQSVNLMGDKNFIKFLDSFRKLSIEAEKAGSKKTAKDFLPSRNTMSKRIDDKLEGVKDDVLVKMELLKNIGGGITLDFAKKNVDYLAATAHFVDNNWCKQDFVIAFSPLSPSVKKTSLYVQKLLSEELQRLGIQDRDMSKLFVTTDEGSNVCCIGGKNHMPCMCHVGATIAKRATRTYKISDLSNQMKETCAEVEVSLHLMEKWVNKLRQNEELRNAASKALKSPAETRWLSYFNMVEAILKNIDILEAAINLICPENEPTLALLEIARKPFFRDYLAVLRPISRMVNEFQSERRVTANWILLHSSSVWNSLLEHSRPCVDSVWRVSMATAALVSFKRKIGDLSDGWMKKLPGKLNKLVTLCAAYLDPFTHAQLRTVCAKIPGWDYEKIKRVVYEYAESITPEVPPPLIPTATSALFQLAPPTPLEEELNNYSLVGPYEDPLEFQKENQKVTNSLFSEFQC